MQYPVCHGSLLLEQPITAQLSPVDPPTAGGRLGGIQQREQLDSKCTDQRLRSSDTVMGPTVKELLPQLTDIKLYFLVVLNFVNLYHISTVLTGITPRPVN